MENNLKKFSEDERIKKQLDVMAWENHIQTLFVALAFFWGVVTIQDLKKKIK